MMRAVTVGQHGVLLLQELDKGPGIFRLVAQILLMHAQGFGLMIVKAHQAVRQIPQDSQRRLAVIMVARRMTIAVAIEKQVVLLLHKLEKDLGVFGLVIQVLFMHTQGRTLMVKRLRQSMF